MKKRIYLILIFILILLSGYLYHGLVYDFKDDLYQEERMITIEGKETILEYNIPFKEVLFLKLKIPPTSVLEKVKFNSDLLKVEEKDFKSTKTYYFYIPKQIIHGNTNQLKLVFSKIPKVDIDVRLYNYRKKFSDNFVVLLSNHHIFKANKSYNGAVFAAILLIGFCFLSRYVSGQVFTFGASRIYKYIFIILFLIGIILGIMRFIPLQLGFRIAITEGYFFTVAVVWGGIGVISIVVKSIVVFAAKGKTCIVFVGRTINKVNKEDLTKILSPLWYKRFIKYFHWLSVRDFSDKCVLLFMVLLIICAFFLILQLEPVAEQLANIAYFALVIGVVIKFVKMVREERRRP